MRTNLNRTITTPEEAREYLTDLFFNGEHYHPEDDATSINWYGAPVTREEANRLNELMAQVYKTGINPIIVLLDLMDKHYGKNKE